MVSTWMDAVVKYSVKSQEWRNGASNKNSWGKKKKKILWQPSFRRIFVTNIIKCVSCAHSACTERRILSQLSNTVVVLFIEYYILNNHLKEGNLLFSTSYCKLSKDGQFLVLIRLCYRYHYIVIKIFALLFCCLL